MIARLRKPVPTSVIYYPAVFLVLMLLGPTKCLKPKANQLAIYMRGRGFELRIIQNKSS